MKTVAYVATVGLAAAWLTSRSLGSAPSVDAIVLLVAVAVLATLASVAPIRFQYGRTVQEITVDEALVILALAASPGWAPVALGVGTLASQLRRDRPTVKALYNSGATTLSAALAAATYVSLLGGAAMGSWRWTVSAVAAGFTNGLVSLLLVSLLMALRQGRKVWRGLPPSLPVNVGIWVANAAVGLLLALIVDRGVAWIGLGGLVLIGLHVGYRGYASARRDRERVHQAMQLSRTLAKASVDADAFRDALRITAERFEASGAVLTLELDGELVVFTEGVDVVPGSVSGSLARVAARARAESLGDARLPDALVSPLMVADRAIGAVAVFDRVGVESWTVTELQLLETISSEMAVAAANVGLIRQIQHERARLQEESGKLADVLAAASDGIAVVGEDGTVATWNPGMTSITGIHPADAIGRPWWSVLRLKDREDRELLPDGEHVVTEALAGERTLEPVPIQALRRDGQWRWTRVSFAPLVHQGRDVEGTVLVARDVTAEHELAALKADFIATVSHELRTPLTPLKGFVTTLKQRHDGLDLRQRDLLLDSMHGQVNRLEQLVADLLLVADLDRGGLALESGSVPLRDAIAAAVHAETPGDQARISVSPGVGGAVAGDRKAVVRILRSLVSNAVKHTGGAIHIETGSDATNRWVSVTDTGPGIPPWEQEKVFERFHRLGDHLLRTQGPGLGLPIAKALAEELGGSLTVRSDVGSGACFTLSLPGAEDAQVREAAPEADRV